MVDVKHDVTADRPPQRHGRWRIVREGGLAVYVQAAKWLRDPANKEGAIKALVAETNAKPEDAALFYQQLVGDGAISTDGNIDPEGFAIWSKFLDVEANALRTQVFDGQYLATVGN